MNRQQVCELARATFITETNTYGCAETSFAVLKSAFDLPNPLDTSAAMALNGGVAWTGGTCGAITGAALAVGLLTGLRVAGHKRAKRIARNIISGLISEFVTEYGATGCIDLIRLDIRNPKDHAIFIEEGIWRDICMRQIEFVVKRLYVLQDQSVWGSKTRQLEGEANEA